ncbi:MAG: prepilin-type N-terminal cleavage/methylation domain-containing protein [Verrucomicrobia bacterium]|nr:prepilin-type N-terminal cleavage/methylation domain-containing protein [Verrucomicrobiota bacterium]
MNYIKTNHKWARQRGTTLIELSVVIAVILLLAGVLFIGVTAWRKQANNAACLVAMSSIQKAVRGEQNFNNYPVGGALAHAQLVTDGYFAVLPADPTANGAAFTYTDTVPATGTQYATSANFTPSATQIQNW